MRGQSDQKSEYAYATTYKVCIGCRTPHFWWSIHRVKLSLLDDTYQKLSFISPSFRSLWAWGLAVKELHKGFAVLKVLPIRRSLL